MRIEPKVVTGKDKELKALRLKRQKQRIAILFVAVIIYFFFIKLLFL